MKAKDAVIATATVLSRMSPQDRAAIARVITMPPGKIESITQEAIYDDVKAIATRSVNAQIVIGKVDDLVDRFREVCGKQK